MAKHYNLDISNFRFAILTSRPTALLGRTAFTAFELFAADKPSADCARRRFSERNRREAAALGAEMGGFAALSIEIPEGEAALRAAELKTKGHLLCRCPFVLACVGKRDADFANQSRPQGGIPNRSPATAGPVWKGAATK